jgi:nucleotide-binding universal stress UspA family protein
MRQAHEQQLVMDREQTMIDARQVTDSGIKTILFHVHEDESVMDRLQLALSLARAFGAHLNCLHVTPIEAYTIVDSFAGTFVNQEIVDALEQRATTLRQRIEACVRIEDVTWNYEEVTGELLPHLIQSASLADLVITGREPVDREFGGPAISLIGNMLAQIRTPLLITGDRLLDFDPFAPAVIGWNGSCEAASAVRGALPLLKMAAKVTVVEFSEDRQRRFPSTSVLEYLSRHGIAAELEVRTTSKGIEDALVGMAQQRGAGMIVIGGYSHSRAGEFLFGGVTRALLKDCPLALVMAR